MARNRSPNPRPRQQRRRREDDTAADAAAETENSEQAPTDGNCDAAASHPTPPSAADTMAIMRQMFEYMNTTQRQNQEQMSQMLQQQVLLQQQMLQAHVAAQKPQKKKGNPPQFNGETNDDLELWLFSTEQYYSNYSEEMQSESSEFVDTIFGNLGPTAQTWYRDFKVSLGEQPATWATFKRCIRERFREADYQHKLLSRLHNLRWSGSQHAYTTKFLHLLSQLECELPEPVKRWYYQQNLRPETSAFVSQNVPLTLKEVIELAERYEDSRASQSGNAKKDQSNNAKPQGKQQAQKKNPAASNRFQSSANTTGKNSDRPTCEYCDKPGHHEGICFKKKADAKASVAKKLVGSVGWHPTEPKPPDRVRRARSGSPLQAGLHYQTSEASTRKKEKIYGYLCQGARVDDASVSVFIDSGASFNAIDPEVAASLNLQVTTLPEPLRVKLGGGQRVSIPRRTSTITVSMDGFPEYATEVFVMEIPEGKNVMLGFPWLEDVNPDIDWAARIVRPRGAASGLALQPCPRARASPVAAGSRRRAPARRHRSDQLDNLLFYAKHDYVSSAGETKVISHRQFRRMQHDDDTFCFAVRVCEETSDKAARQLSQGWDQLRGRPEEAVVVKYKNTVFRAELPNVAPQRSVDVEAEVELSDDTPVARKQFRLSDAMKEAIRAWTLEMLEAGIIRPSKSPYCAPTFCVKKAVGWRIVHDFRGINSKLRIPATPVPRKEDIFDAMAGGYYFSAMDLLWGFFQVRLREKDIQYTAFSTPDGQFEYLVTPMGLACSPSAFNRMMQRVFSDQRSFCRAYFDDLFVFTKTPSLEDHLEALDKVLKRCEEQQLYIKLEKCTFCAGEIPCLGDFFGREGIRMDPDKSRVIREWPLPRTRRQLQSFVGTCVYVLKYCENFAELAAPLMEATRGRGKNEQISLTPAQVRSFEELKRLLSDPPMLAHPDSSRPFHVRMDASDYAIGGYLYQVGDNGNEHVISYGGRKLSEAEKMYPTREKELLAALHAMRLWRVYLIDKPFFVNTDHRTLQSILEQKTCSQRLARWLNELGSYRPLFRWIPGTSNVVADAISRNPAFEPTESAQHVSLASLLQQLTRQHDESTADDAYLHYMAARPSIHQQCTRLYRQDATFGLLYQYLVTRAEASAPPPVEVPRTLRANLNHFFLEDGLLFYQPSADLARRLCIPDDNDLRNAIFFEHHDSATSGHPGYLKTLMALQNKFYWPRMDRAVRRYVASCEMCQRIKVSQRKAAGLLHPLEVPANRWTNITMDFVTGLPIGRRSKSDAIMVIVDRLTKRAHFVLTTTTCTAHEAARLFRDHYQRLHGLPLSIVSDRDSKFTSKLWSELMSFQRTQLQLSSAFRPETDGQTEKTNHFVADYLRAFVNARHDDWDEMLSLAEFAYNARVHSSIGMAPFTADLGYIPRSVADLATPSTRGRRSQAMKFVEHQQVVLQQCKDMLEQSQAAMKYFHDRNRPTFQFAEGDQVLLNTSNLDLHHLGTTGKRKLAPRYIGPYPVIKSTTPDTYQIGLPPGLQLHDEFHVSYLRPYVFDSNPRRLNDVPPLITRDGFEGVQVQAILQRRVRNGKVQFKVRWYGRDNKDSWEPEENLEQVRGLIERFLLAQPRRSTRQRSA